MIRIAICDDESYMLRRIRDAVYAFFQKKHMETETLCFSDSRGLLGYDGKFDLLFLDIQMAHTDGMEAARALRRRGFRGYLIFITVLEEQVFRAFEVQAFDYLVKPLEQKAFERTMERLVRFMECEDRDGLLIRRGNESMLLSPADILFCEAMDRKVYLYLRSGQVIDYYDRIERLEDRLGNRFFRCHRSYLINLGWLRSYRDGAACLEGGREVPVSRLRRKEFFGVVLEYMKRHKAGDL